MIRKLTFGLLALLTTFLWSCSDDNLLIQEPDINQTEAPKEQLLSIVDANGNEVTHFSHNFGRYYLDVKAEGDWELDSKDTFLAPAQTKGNGPTLVPLIVGNNWFEKRTGSISLKTLNAHSRAEDPSGNVDVEQDAYPNLADVKDIFSSNRGAGYSYTPNTNFTMGTNIEIFNMKNLEELQKSAAYQLYTDDYIPQVEEHLMTATTDYELSAKLSVSASVDLKFSKFSVNVTGHFDGSKEDTKKSEYAVKRMKSYMFSRELNWANLLALANSSKAKEPEVLSPGFIYLRDKFINGLANADTPDKKIAVCKEFVDKTGPLFITKGVMGCCMDYYVKVNTSVLKEGMTVGGALEINILKNIKIEGQGEYSQDQKNIVNNSESSITLRGGDVKQVSIITTGGTIENTQFKAWQQSVQPKQSVLVDMQLVPIYFLIDDDNARQTLKEYIDAILSASN